MPSCDVTLANHLTFLMKIICLKFWLETSHSFTDGAGPHPDKKSRPEPAWSDSGVQTDEVRLKNSGVESREVRVQTDKVRLEDSSVESSWVEVQPKDVRGVTGDMGKRLQDVGRRTRHLYHDELW